MNCTDLLSHLSDYFDGQLSAELLEEIQAHTADASTARSSSTPPVRPSRSTRATRSTRSRRTSRTAAQSHHDQVSRCKEVTLQFRSAPPPAEPQSPHP